MHSFEMRLIGHTGPRRTSFIGQHVCDHPLDRCDMKGFTTAGDRIPISVKTNDRVAVLELLITEHVIKERPLSGVGGEAVSWCYEIHIASQHPDALRKRIDSHEAATAFPNIQRDRRDELKGQLLQVARTS